MKGKKVCVLAGLLLFILYGHGFAHFGMVIPSDSMVMQGEGKTITLVLSFSHPFEGEGMDFILVLKTGGED